MIPCATPLILRVFEFKRRFPETLEAATEHLLVRYGDQDYRDITSDVPLLQIAMRCIVCVETLDTAVELTVRRIPLAAAVQIIE